MAEILLIHGSCHGAWCWRDVVPLLAAHGHDVRAIDLPGAGVDPTPAGEVTLGACVAALVAAISGRAVVVGHSLGGAAITAAAAAAPERIIRLVCLAAFAPAPGEKVADLRAAAGCAALTDATRLADDGHSQSYADAALDELFYHDCPPETRTFARARLRPQATAIAAARMPASGTSVPRSYVVCDRDRAIPPAAQRASCAGWPADTVHTLPTGHSPFFAAPRKLADLLHLIATKDPDARQPA